MRVHVTLTKIKFPNQNAKTVAHDAFIEGDNLVFLPAGTVLKIHQYLSDGSFVEYTTDFAFSGVDAVLDAAAETGGIFTLT